MTTIVTRAGKGSPLTNNEVDANFTNLNDAKIETLTSTDSSVTITGTGASRDLSVDLTRAGDVDGPASSTDNAITRFDGTTGKLVQNSTVTLDDNGNIAGIRSTQYSGAVPATQPIGTMWFDSTTDTLNFQQNAITQQIGEELFIYGKASAAINDNPLQIIYHTGTVGASGVVQFAPTIAGITDENAIIGVATEPIALNGFGRVTAYGVVHGINTTGSAFGETWADDDVIWYNPVTGNPTKVKPVAPNIKFQIGLVINAGSGGSGSFQVLLQPGTQFGGTDSNVQLTSPTAAQLLTYSTASGYWKNTSLAAGTGISVGAASSGVLTVTNSAPDQVVALTGAGTTAVTGTYPNFTITSSDAYTGTVTNVSATAPLAVANGSTTPAVSISQANTTTDGYLSSTDWNTFNNKYTLPTQTGNAGKVLTTDGSSATWQNVNADPAGTAVALAIALG